MTAKSEGNPPLGSMLVHSARLSYFLSRSYSSYLSNLYDFVIVLSCWSLFECSKWQKQNQSEPKNPCWIFRLTLVEGIWDLIGLADVRLIRLGWCNLGLVWIKPLLLGPSQNCWSTGGQHEFWWWCVQPFWALVAQARFRQLGPLIVRYDRAALSCGWCDTDRPNPPATRGCSFLWMIFV